MQKRSVKVLRRVIDSLQELLKEELQKKRNRRPKVYGPEPPPALTNYYESLVGDVVRPPTDLPKHIFGYSEISEIKAKKDHNWRKYADQIRPSKYCYRCLVNSDQIQESAFICCQESFCLKHHAAHKKARHKLVRNPDLNLENKDRWSSQGRSSLDSLPFPESLKQLIRESLETPQYGPYHNEGAKMDSHLGLMMENISDIISGTFDFDAVGLDSELSKVIKPMIVSAIQENSADMRVYAYLHDLEKPNCMALKFRDKTQKIISLKDWREILESHNYNEAAVIKYLDSQGVKSITYRHDESLTGGEAKDHGPEGGKTLRQLAKIDPGIAEFIKTKDLILTGIENHEMHFQVFSNAKSAKQYDANLIKNFNQEQIAFIFAACLIDIASSLGPDGNPDYSGFRNMVEAMQCYQIAKSFVDKMAIDGKPLKVDDVNALMNAAGTKTLQERITKLSVAPSRKNLTDEEINKILDRWSDFGLPDDKREIFENSLRSDNYGASLNAAGLAKLIGKIKTILK